MPCTEFLFIKVKKPPKMLENLDYYSANELIVNTFAFLQKIFDDFEVLA